MNFITIALKINMVTKLDYDLLLLMVEGMKLKLKMPFEVFKKGKKCLILVTILYAIKILG